ncbi:MAG: phosphoglucosamine mutase [Candidatus Bathyarchaeota archaeon]|nr:MAG: phosphoglucosamine mutase [Candidatus Bathyarchaeota archaeon]
MGKSRRLFGTNGIRGVVNKELTPEFAIRIAEAIGTYFKRGRILLGYDGRISNIMLANAVTSGLVSTGCDVYDAGMAPTPCIQYAVKNHEMDGGVMITASHNPAEYNGIKVMANDGVEIPREQELKIENMFFENEVFKASWDGVGQRHNLPRALGEYKEAIKKHIDPSAIKKRHLHVVVDAANGVGGLTTPYLLRELGCRVTTINANIDGTFPNRQPEPRPESLQDLATTVESVKADFGVAFDGDADRSIFVDEKGKVHWGDRTFALIEKNFLQTNPGAIIVTPVSSSQVVKDVAEKYDGKLTWTKVGSTIVSHTMKKLKAKLGGEENGGVFYGPHQPVRDGAMTVALVLHIMAKDDRALSRLLDELPRYYLEKDKIRCPNEQKPLVLRKLVAELESRKPETIDGLKLWFPDKSSILLRPSGTEPIYRFYAEAKTKERASMLVKEYKQKVQQQIIKS